MLVDVFQNSISQLKITLLALLGSKLTMDSPAQFASTHSLLVCHLLGRFWGDPLASKIVVPRRRGEPFVPLILLYEGLEILLRESRGCGFVFFAFLFNRLFNDDKVWL
jgi:hypothetical protein